MEKLTSGHELDQLVKNYIVSCIDPEVYDLEFPDRKSRVKFLYDTFYSEVGKWSIPQKGFLKSFEDYLMGLPSICNIAFYNKDILDLAILWGALPENPTEKQEDKFLENYWNLMANKSCQLFRKYGLNTLNPGE